MVFHNLIEDFLYVSLLPVLEVLERAIKMIFDKDFVLKSTCTSTTNFPVLVPPTLQECDLDLK